MAKINYRVIVTGLGIVASILMAACQAASQPKFPGAPAVSPSLRIAVLPVIDTLPMYVAQKEGLFDKHAVKVELIPIASAPERDQLIASGQVDGMVNEALSTAFFNKEKVEAQVIRYARVATSEHALFSILAAANSDLQAVVDLKGIEIGISQGTVIEYLTDRLLQMEGFSKDDIRTIAVPKISDRMNLLQNGELKAGMLPEPLTTLAIANGARLILDDSSHPEYSFSTITFRKDVIDKNPESVRGFLQAIEDAVGLINQEPAKYNDLLIEQKVVPPTLKDQFSVPPFVTAGVPSEAQWDDMIAWAIEKGLLEQAVAYGNSVNASFLPK